MKKTLLQIYLDQLYTFSTSSNKRIVEEYLKQVFDDSIIIEEHRIISLFNIKNEKNKYWLIFDANYNLVGLNQEVPDVLILCYMN